MHRCRNGVQPSVTDLNLTPETEEFSYISQVRLSSQYSAMILDISCYNICSPVINIHKYIKRPLVELHLSIECLFISICLCITSQLVLLGLLINHSLSLSTVACTVDISQNGISEKTHFARSRKHNMKTENIDPSLTKQNIAQQTTQQEKEREDSILKNSISQT